VCYSKIEVNTETRTAEFQNETRDRGFRDEDQLNAKIFTNLLHFSLYFPSNTFRRAAIFRKENIALLYKALKTLECAVSATVKIFLKCLNPLKFLHYSYILAWFVGAVILVWRSVALWRICYNWEIHHRKYNCKTYFLRIRVDDSCAYGISCVGQRLVCLHFRHWFTTRIWTI
jgi:hypothetical protein